MPCALCMFYRYIFNAFDSERQREQDKLNRIYTGVLSYFESANSLVSFVMRYKVRVDSNGRTW